MLWMTHQIETDTKVIRVMPNSVGIEQSGQDQGRVNLTLELNRETLISKEIFKAPKAAVAGLM